MAAKESTIPENIDQTEPSPRLTNFSIDAILSTTKSESPKKCLSRPDEDRFAWLRCSRYKPPKLPRRKETYKRRNFGRSARIPFSSHQVATLEAKFRTTRYLNSFEVTELGQQLGISEIRVKIWFQNRRARQRRERQTSFQQMIPLDMNPNYFYESFQKHLCSPVIQDMSWNQIL